MPIQWAIIHGLAESGVSTFSLQHAIDTGDVLLRERVAIDKADDAGALYGKLLNSGKALLVETVDRLVTGDLQPRPQASENPQLEAPKLNRENTSIDWSESTDIVLNKIRGLHPFPKAWTVSPHGDIKVLKAHAIDPASVSSPEAQPGDTALVNGVLAVRCSDGWIGIDELIPPGKGRMSGFAWSNGLQTPLSHLGIQA